MLNTLKHVIITTIKHITHPDNIDTAVDVLVSLVALYGASKFVTFAIDATTPPKDNEV